MAALPNQEPTPLVGSSRAIEDVKTEIDSAARSDARVLITGETGVGKEIAARLIHERSHRRSGPLMVLNCAGLPDSLLESELFGHTRGSFTGAYRDKPGLLEMASHGTAFLDEVGEMSVRMQVVLLRFLETGEIQRVGADRADARVSVRLIAATNRDLPAEIASGAFREDLYFRLNVIRIAIPPLRERPEDIPPLLDHFLELFSRHRGVAPPQVSPAALQVMMDHSWPGNVRELKNLIERLITAHPGTTLRATDLSRDILPTARRGDGTAHRRCGDQRQDSSVAEELTTLMACGESFWTTVYPAFMSRDITRDDLRKIVAAGLAKTNGNYRQLTGLFNMPDSDYKRLSSFLRTHGCHLPFQRFRATPAQGDHLMQQPQRGVGSRGR